MTSKILALDIETSPTLAYVWKFFRENISLDQVKEPGDILCVGAQWVGTNKKFFLSTWGNGRQDMLEGIHELISQADAILTYNGDSFDLKKLNGAFLVAGLKPVPPITSIDLYKTVKKMGFVSGKLAFVGPLLGLGGKTSHEGFMMWRKVLDGDEKARRKMEKYCQQDVTLLCKLYDKMKGHIKSHPHLGEDKHECGACGSNHVQSRGYRRTKTFKIQRIQCQNCGSWADGKRTKIV